MDEIIKKEEEEERKKMEEIIKAEQEEDEEISFIENMKEIKNNEEIKTLFLNLLDEKYYFLGKVGRLNLNQRLGIRVPMNQQKITIHDIFGIINYFSKVETFFIDDIDDLKNRRIRSIGELLQIQFKIGLLRLERNITEKIDLNKKKIKSTI
jgi:DNA-directed RNA polymerase subunit beta